MQKKRERLREEKGKREYKYDVHVDAECQSKSEQVIQ